MLFCPHQLFNLQSARGLVAVIDHRDDRSAVQQMDRAVSRTAVIGVEEEEL